MTADGEYGDTISTSTGGPSKETDAAAAPLGGVVKSLRKSIISWLNPDAHDAQDNMGTSMEAYFDKTTNKWVFPDDDGSEAPPAHLVPPPTSMGGGVAPGMGIPQSASGPSGMGAVTGGNHAPAEDDMLSALMAPPSRPVASAGPPSASLSRNTSGPPTSGLSSGGLPLGSPSLPMAIKPGQFSVFTPPKVSTPIPAPEPEPEPEPKPASEPEAVPIPTPVVSPYANPYAGYAPVQPEVEMDIDKQFAAASVPETNPNPNPNPNSVVTSQLSEANTSVNTNQDGIPTQHQGQGDALVQAQAQGGEGQFTEQTVSGQTMQYAASNATPAYDTQYDNFDL